MTLEEAFYSKATGTSGISALISTRLYPNFIPEGAALPAAAYQRVATARQPAHDGTTGHARGNLQVTCQATTYSAVKAVAAQFVAAFHGVKGTWGGSVEVFRSAVETEIDGEQGEDAATVRVDLLIDYREA